MMNDNEPSKATQMEAESIPDKLREIKQELRAMMNGPVSQAMRQRGLSYKVNFGVELPRLQEFATSLPHDRRLAIALWQEDIRECRLLAGMVMPVEDFSADLATLWFESIRFTEEADCTVFHLLRHEPWASQLVMPWLASERTMFRYGAYVLICQLLRQGKRFTTRDAMEFLDHARADIEGDERSVALAARRAVLHYAECGMAEERLAKSVVGI